jgi:hypothetical protein
MMPRMGGRPILVVSSGLIHPSLTARLAFAGHDRPTLFAAGPSADPGPFADIPGFAVTD